MGACQGVPSRWAGAAAARCPQCTPHSDSRDPSVSPWTSYTLPSSERRASPTRPTVSPGSTLCRARGCQVGGGREQTEMLGTFPRGGPGDTGPRRAAGSASQLTSEASLRSRTHTLTYNPTSTFPAPAGHWEAQHGGWGRAGSCPPEHRGGVRGTRRALAVGEHGLAST